MDLKLEEKKTKSVRHNIGTVLNIGIGSGTGTDTGTVYCSYSYTNNL